MKFDKVDFTPPTKLKKPFKETCTIRTFNPSHSEEIQQYLLARGWKSFSGSREVKHTRERYLVLNCNSYGHYLTHMEYNHYNYREITFEELKQSI